MTELSPILPSPLMPASSKEEAGLSLDTPVELGELKRTTTSKTPPSHIQYPALVDGEMLLKNVKTEPEKVKNDLGKIFTGEKPTMDGAYALFLHAGLVPLLQEEPD
jgi:hypothetical protein